MRRKERENDPDILASLKLNRLKLSKEKLKELPIISINSMKQDFLCVSFINYPEFYEIQGLGIVGWVVVRFSKFLFFERKIQIVFGLYFWFLDFSSSFLSTSHSRRKVVYVTGSLK